MATKTIGPSGDYTTLAAYATYLDTLNVLSAAEIGEVQNTALNLGTTSVDFTGFTPSATFPWTLRPASGAGFKDNGSAATNALRANAANGALIYGDCAYNYLVKISVPYATIQGLQWSNTSVAATASLQTDGDNLVVDGNVFQSGGQSNASTAPLKLVGTTTYTVKNNVIICDAGGSQSGIYAVLGSTILNNTIARPSNQAAGGAGIFCGYNTFTIQNDAIFGFTTPVQKNSATLTGTGNAIDAASYATGLSGQVSLVAATEFEQPSNAAGALDLRLKSTSVKCKDNGTNSGAPTTDIIGQAISNTTRDAGAWELQQGGGGTQTLTPSLFTNSSTFYAPTVTRGAVTLTPSLFTNSSTFYAPTITRGAVTLTPSLFTNGNTFYSPTVSQSGTQTLTPSLFTNSSTFYAATVTRGTVTLTPALFTNSATFYGPTVIRGAVTLSPALFTNASTFYSPTVTRGTVTLTPALLTNTSAFYAAVVTQSGPQALLPSLFANDNTFYSPTVSGGVQPETPAERIVYPAYELRRVVVGGEDRLITVAAENRTVVAQRAARDVQAA